MIDPCLLENVFHKIVTDIDEYYWRDCVDSRSGYYIVFSDGDILHTYHYPPDFLRNKESST